MSFLVEARPRTSTLHERNQKLESATEAVRRARANEQNAQRDEANQRRNQNYRKVSSRIAKIIALMPKANYLADRALLSYDFIDGESEKALTSGQVILKQSRRSYTLWFIANGYHCSYWLREDETIWKTACIGSMVSDNQNHHFERWMGSGLDDAHLAQVVFRNLRGIHRTARWRAFRNSIFRHS